MKHKNNNNKFLEEINNLQIEANLTKGHMDALKFARSCKGVVAQIEIKIEKTKREIAKSLNEQSNDNLLKQYFVGFLLGLENSLKVIEVSINDSKLFVPSEIYPTQVEFNLAWASLPISGRYQALIFTLSHLGDLEKLETEIKETKKLISSPENPAYKETSSPGRHKRGYLKGLEDAIKILLN